MTDRANPGDPADPADRAMDPRLADGLGRLFGDVDPAFVDEVARVAELHEIASGKILVNEGDPGDAAFLVLSGRLRAMAATPDGDRRLSDACAGEIVGELALLAGASRSATVHAVRDSVVARIATADFERLLERHPAAAVPISRLIADRLRRLTITVPPSPPAQVTIAVLAVHAADAEAFAHLLQASMPADVPAELVRAGSVAGEPGSHAWHRGLDDLEQRVPGVIIAGAPADDAWNRAVLRRTDEVILLADAAEDPGRGPADELVFAPRGRGGPRVTLVLRQTEAYPSGTAAWLAERPVDGHLHVRADDPEDAGRVGRWVTGRSVGLVLGGGGARGWAHLGAARAMREIGVPIDLVGGTSHGALVGAVIADRHEIEEMIRVGADYVKRVKDPTIPLVSLIRGRHILRGIRRVARPGADIADLWLPYFAVATNLTRAEPVVIDRGSIEDAIRASCSLPVILPPIVNDDGDLIVDGGVLDNLPIGPMRRRIPTGPIVAVDPSPRGTPVRYDPIEPDVSGFALLRDRLLRRQRRVPTLGDVILQTVVVGSIHLRRGARPDPDLLLLAPTLGTHGLLDFGVLREVAGEGYRETRGPIAAWWAARGTAGVRSGDAPP
jgi:predicted acylesterase/phospholipase RssA/CRP-like cAMP-binding protein